MEIGSNVLEEFIIKRCLGDDGLFFGRMFGMVVEEGDFFFFLYLYLSMVKMMNFFYLIFFFILIV